MCSSLRAQRLIPRLQSCSQWPLLLSRSSGRPCAGLWLIANAFHWCWDQDAAAAPESDLTGSRSLVYVPARWYLPLLDRCKLRFSSQDSVAAVAWPVGLLLLLLLPRDVASLLQSWCRRERGAEISEPGRRTGARLPGAFRDAGRRRGSTYLPHGLLDVALLPPGVEGWRSWCVRETSDFSSFANRCFLPFSTIQLMVICFPATF